VEERGETGVPHYSAVGTGKRGIDVPHYSSSREQEEMDRRSRYSAAGNVDK